MDLCFELAVSKDELEFLTAAKVYIVVTTYSLVCYGGCIVLLWGIGAHLQNCTLPTYKTSW
jgi:hypothetical protein